MCVRPGREACGAMAGSLNFGLGEKKKPVHVPLDTALSLVQVFFFHFCFRAATNSSNAELCPSSIGDCAGLGRLNISSVYVSVRVHAGIHAV